jgi:hypothetical protein
MRLDVAELRGQLEEPVRDDAAAPPLDWLADSWREPAPFWRALAHYHARMASPAAKSFPGEGFDFGHDLVLRHAPERVAFRWYSPRGWILMTYGELELRSRVLAEEWLSRGLQPGAPVCLLLPMGEELVVALVAALRIGLVLTLVPPLGPRWVARRLQQVQATLVTTRMYGPLVGGAKVLFLSERPATPSSRRASYTYAADATAAQLHSEHVAEGAQPAELRAEDLYLGALRDGLLALSLRPGELVAAPGLSLLSSQPTLLIATLLCGATFVHLDLKQLSADASLLTGLPLRAVGIGVELRDILLRSEEPIRGWQHWFRNPEERLDWSAWRRFVRQRGLAEVPVSNLAFDASTGGAVLWSRRRAGEVHAAVLPAAGRPWSLTALSGLDAEGRGPEAGGDFGLMTTPGRRPYQILVRAGREYHYGGTLDARSDGKVYPSAEVAEAAAALPFAVGAAVVMDRAGALGQPLKVLVVFTGDLVTGHAERRAVSDAVTQALGPAFAPDRIVLVPLYPRRQAANGPVDARWCETQYASGLLYHKPRQPLFQQLTALRAATVERRR